ncbi:serine/threonine kinase PKN11 [Plesiocystis pacifica SIR-1]|uniref:Serine/threonine kinase PKN11 n=1 Tax=Plesiocystis pacifica SIR-1 TaxID=391625 RepID=A6G9D2_9BACT|nr:protein kinase [Plesiocystis pacifica]EDM77554.1 serine/threonine kinase PKN11 [Plesiocystis pacifica SIR-1]
MAEELPRPFGRYVLTRLIGEGGMAEVYRASVRVAEGLTKWVVIKKIRADFADDRDFTRMFVDEAKIALSLNHANIVQVFDFGQIRGTFYLAMELIEGVDLMRLFHAVRAHEDDAFPAVIGAYLGHQVASGLAYAHRKCDDYGAPLDIVHRDVSPHNLMLSFEGQVKILDFGIARTRKVWDRRDKSQAAPELETIKGKVAYMSPEQSMGKPVDQRSDLYSLGVVLYELLTGELLFRTRDRLQALELVRTQPIPPILERAPDLPDELAHIVDKALARDLDERWQSAREMQSALAQYLHRADPVVDDEVLSQFLAPYREDERPQPPVHPSRNTGNRSGPSISALETREVGDSAQPIVAMRSSGRCVLLHASFTPRTDELAPEFGDRRPDVASLLDLVRDVAFKREAQVYRLDESGATLAFGTMLGAGDDAERALRVALTLRESVGEYAPGIDLGVVLLATHVTMVRSEEGSIRVELPEGLAEQLGRVAEHIREEPVMVAGDLVERLRRGWRLGAEEWLNPQIPEEAAGSPWAADFQRVAPVLGPLSEAERRSKQTWVGRRHLYGRELELKALRDNFAEAIRGPETRSVVILGSAGMGKRAVLDRFIASLPSGACAVLRGVGQWSTRNQPLGVFLTLLRRFLRIEAETRIETVTRKLRDYGVAEADELAEALLSALGSHNGGRGRGRPARVAGNAARIGEQLDPLLRRERIGKLIRRLIRALAQRRPVLIVIENLHFIDEPSLRVLESWSESQHALPILGVSTARPGPRADSLARRERVAVIELHELDPTAAREMILRRFEDPSEAEELAEAILARTGGHPLFIEEILASLLHRGVVAWNAQARHLVVRDRGAVIELPPSIEGALQARVDELAPEDRDTLLAAAILGRRFRAPELAELLDQPAKPIARSLNTLIAASLIERDGVEPLAMEPLNFSTVSLHEVCKGLVPPGSLEHLHGRAAELKQRRADYTPGRDDGPIADHLMFAARYAEAFVPAMRAARHAENVAGNVEAYYYLTQALRALDNDDPRRFDVLLEREPILRAWGRRRAQGADIRQLIAVAEALEGDEGDEKQVVASLRLLRFYLECGRTHRATRLVPRLQTKVHGLRAPSAYLAVLGELESELMFARGKFEEARTIAEDALDFCGNDTKGVRQRVRLLRAIGRVQLGVGRLEPAGDTFREALHLARSIGHRRLEAEALNNLGEVAGRSTHYQEAVDCFKAALAIDRDLGDRFATGVKLANLGLTYTAIGLYRRAERHLRKALELHEAIGHPGLLNDVMVSLGIVVAHLGDVESAHTLLVDAARVAARRDDSRTQLRAEVCLAQVLVHALGEPGSPPEEEALVEAQAVAARVYERGRAEGLRTATARAAHVLAIIAAMADDEDSAIAFERDAVRLIRAGAAPLDGVRSLHHLGLLLRNRGQEAEARALLSEAATAVQSRLDDLRDYDLREGYQSLPDFRRIIRDGRLF